MRKYQIYSEDLIVHLSRFSSIIEEICALATDIVSFQYDSLSLWWQNIRESLLESQCALMSLLAAMMYRNHAARYRKREVILFGKQCEAFNYCMLFL